MLCHRTHFERLTCSTRGPVTRTASKFGSMCLCSILAFELRLKVEGWQLGCWYPKVQSCAGQEVYLTCWVHVEAHEPKCPVRDLKMGQNLHCTLVKTLFKSLTSTTHLGSQVPHLPGRAPTDLQARSCKKEPLRSQRRFGTDGGLARKKRVKGDYCAILCRVVFRFFLAGGGGKLLSRS